MKRAAETITRLKSQLAEANSHLHVKHDDDDDDDDDAGDDDDDDIIVQIIVVLTTIILCLTKCCRYKALTLFVVLQVYHIYSYILITSL